MTEDLTWHVAETATRAERGVQLALSEAGYATLWLHYPATVRHARRVIGVLRPLFPGYVFFGVAPGGSVRPVYETRGVTGIVAGADGPCVLPSSVMADLRARCDETGKVGLPRDRRDDGRPRLPEGAEVNIVDGPLKGLPGIVERDDGGEVRVLVSLFGRPMPTAIAASALRVMG